MHADFLQASSHMGHSVCTKRSGLGMHHGTHQSVEKALEGVILSKSCQVHWNAVGKVSMSYQLLHLGGIDDFRS